LNSHAHEFMDMNVDVEPDWGSTAASDRGAGPLGFTGTVAKNGEQGAVGLARMSDDGFGGGPSLPMLPNTWSPGGQ
jgi:hypothetical protein